MDFQKRGKTEEGGEATLYRDPNRWLLTAASITTPGQHTHVIHPDRVLLEAFADDSGIRVTWD
jgi:hypothetical protein